MTNQELWQSIEGSSDFSADTLDAYIQGNLPPEQQAEFEAYIIDKPELLEQVELGVLMREGFKSNETASVAPTDRVEPQWRLAAVAAFVSIGIGSLIGYSMGGGTPDEQFAANSRLFASQIINLPITRSQVPRQIEVAIDPDTELIVLRIPLPNPETGLYKVSITNDAGPIGEPSLTPPDGGGVLNLAVNAESLTVGSYSILVDKPDGAEPVEPITLKVTRPP